jgi:uncharacterized SAM-binding protein YcdF (DUF218 family)
MKKNGWKLAVGGLVAAFLMVCLVAALFLAAGEFLVHSDTLARSGAVVLLAGGDKERLGEAAHLMRERYAELLILTDTDSVGPGGMVEWEYVRLEMIALGVSPAQIQPTYHTVASTRDEGKAVLEYLQRHKVSSCIVVTDPYHTRRTRMIFNQEFAGSSIEVRVVAAREHWYSPSGWFLSPRGWQATLSEYGKIVTFLLKI